MCDTYWDALDEAIYTVFCRLTKLRMQTDTDRGCTVKVNELKEIDSA